MKISYNELYECIQFELASSSNLEISPLKPGKAKMEPEFCFSTSLEGRYKEHILFLYVFSECEGTFTIFQKEKSTAMKLLQKRLDLQDAIHIFSHSNVFNALLTGNDIKFFLCIYVSSKEKSLYQYLDSTKLVTKNNMVIVNNQPST